MTTRDKDGWHTALIRVRGICRGQHPRARIADADPFLHIALLPERERRT